MSTAARRGETGGRDPSSSGHGGTAGHGLRGRAGALAGDVGPARGTTPRDYNSRVQVHASAPTRIDLAGGTLDIWPLYLFHPGAQTVNAAIVQRAACTVSASRDRRVQIVSEDTGASLYADTWRRLATDGDNRLLAHIVRYFEADGVRVATRAASPLGAGIAGSSALNVAVCAALAEWCRVDHPAEQLLTLAMNLEARTLGIPTGVQDYRPALYGGISAIELGPAGVRRVALDVDPTDLGRRIVLAYSGDSRSSGINNWEITRRHIEGDATVVAHFRRIAEIAAATRDALSRGDWAALAKQVTLEWRERKALAPGITTPAIDRLFGAASGAGATAGKVCGAGGGGCVFFLTEPQRRDAVREAVAGAGARLLDSPIDLEGLRVERLS